MTLMMMDRVGLCEPYAGIVKILICGLKLRFYFFRPPVA
jgi:hypothetical protein